MAFEAAYNKVVDIVKRRTDELIAGSRRSWALKTGETTKAQIDGTFDRTADNVAWEALHSIAGGADVSMMAHYAARVAFCASANRDLRIQYARGTGCTPRNFVHKRMNNYTQGLARQRTLAEFKRLNDSKGISISGPAGGTP
jgi:hypothetical protein